MIIVPLYLLISFLALPEIAKIEATAKWIFWQTIQAVKYLHYNNIVHRDIKLDNIIISSESIFI